MLSTRVVQMAHKVAHKMAHKMAHRVAHKMARMTKSINYMKLSQNLYRYCFKHSDCKYEWRFWEWWHHNGPNGTQCGTQSGANDDQTFTLCKIYLKIGAEPISNTLITNTNDSFENIFNEVGSNGTQNGTQWHRWTKMESALHDHKLAQRLLEAFWLRIWIKILKILSPNGPNGTEKGTNEQKLKRDQINLKFVQSPFQMCRLQRSG